ncbi:metal-dependent hydrolase [Chitinimonas lacunae]|uniref:Metal-dependent hydrolase n=1 Tax=Chitinimonas lacunae TaxID=1963018 RepID=A0ABV8MSY9_9NEIS
MSPITHLLIGWSAGNAVGLRGRDLALVTWAGVLPDLDGAGALLDILFQAAGQETQFYAMYHRYLLHGLFGALAIAGILCRYAVSPRRVFWLALLTIHLHFLGDLLGSRGADPAEIWPIFYLEPVSSALRLSWSGQWPLNAWPNIVLTLGLLLWGLWLGIRDGHTPLGVISARADRAVVAALRARFGR